MSTTGTIAYMGFGIESATAASPGSIAVCGYAPFESEGLALQRNDIPVRDITAQWDIPLVVAGPENINGAVAMTADLNTIGFFLRTFFDATTTALASVGSQAGWASNALVSSDATCAIHRFFTDNIQFQSGSGSDTPTLTLAVYRGPGVGVGSAYAYANMTSNGFEFSTTAGQPARTSFDMMGRSHGRIARATPTYQTQVPLMWHQASISIDGTASILYESLTLRGNNNLEIVRTHDGSRTAANRIKRSDYRTLEMSGTILYQDDVEYDRFVAGSEANIRLLFTVSSTQKLLFCAPKTRYKAFPVQVGGPGRVNVPFQADVLYHSGSGLAMDVYLINGKLTSFLVNSTG